MQILKEVSLGNLLSVSTVIVAAAVAWGTFSNRVSGTEAKIADSEKRIEGTRSDISQMNTTVGRMDERMKNMERSLDKQEMMLQEIMKKLK